MKWDDLNTKQTGSVKWDDLVQVNASPNENTGTKIQRVLLGGTGTEPLSDALMTTARGIPRQLGLAARYGIEGVGDTADFLASPVRAALNSAGMDIRGSSGRTLANALNLPTPQTPTERVVGDASRMLAAAGTGVGLAGKAAQATTGLTQQVLQALASNPGVQASSAIGAGAAGGTARELGGGPLAQTAAAVAGGIAAPVAVSGVQRVGSGTADLIRRIAGSPSVNQNIDNVIGAAVQDNGLTLADLPESVKQTLRIDMQKAMHTGDLSPDVVRRLVDYRLTGTTPTAGPLTLDPGTVTRQKNLAALGVSSQDPNLQSLAQIENANARRLVANLNDLGAGSGDDALAAGQKVINALSGLNARKQAEIGGLYNAVRDAEGRSAVMDAKTFSNNVANAIDEKSSMEFLPSAIQKKIDEIATGAKPLTVKYSETLKTLIGNMQRNSSDGNTRYALGLVREALDNTPVMGSEGQAAKTAADIARGTNREWMRTVENTPALQAVRDGMEPDKFVQSYIIGSGKAASVNDVMRLRNLINDSPEALTAIKNNLAQTLKRAALNGKPDELARFSSSNYNRMLDSIGAHKLGLFFSPDEVQALKAIGRVSSYEQFQPAGAAVNNSKTAAALLASILDRIGGNIVARKLTGGISAGLTGVMSQPLRNAAASGEASRLTQIPATLLARSPKDPIFKLPPVLAPYLLTGPEQE